MTGQGTPRTIRARPRLLARNLLGSSAVRPRELGLSLRRALREAARFDRGALAPLAGARVALAVVLALVIGRIFANPGAEASLAAGALLAGIPAAAGTGRMSALSLAVLSAGMGVSAFVGSASGGLGWVHTAVLVPWCLLAGLLISLGSAATAVGTQGLVAMIVFGRFAEPPGTAAHLAGYVLAGGLLATLIMVVTRPPVTSAVQRRGIAAALTSLAEMAAAGATKRHGVASAEALETADRLLDQGLRFEGAEILQLRALLDVARRSRLEVLAIEGLSRRLIRLDVDPSGASGHAVDGALSVAAEAFAALGAGVTAARAEGGQAVHRSTEAAARARVVLEEAGTGRGSAPGQAAAAVALALEDHLAALSGQVRAAAELVGRAGTTGGRRAFRAGAGPGARSSWTRARDSWEALWGHTSLRSPIGRHALRLAVVVTAAEVVAAHTPLGRGYWVALTAAVVLRPDFSVTFSRGLARMLGTCLGVVLAGLLAVVLHGHPTAEIVGIGVLCLAACASFPASYAAFSAFLTGLVVLLVGVVTPSTVTTALDRLLDTVVGGALALLAYALWPTWSQQQAPQAIAALIGRQRDYLGSVLAAVSGARSLDRDQLRVLAREARRAKAEADDALVRSAEEPERHRFNLPTGQGILAALSRISLATHALRTDIEAGRPAEPVPELAALAGALNAALAEAGTVAAGSTPASPGGPRGRLADAAPAVPAWPLRPCYERLVAAVGDRGDSGPLLTFTDELVDAGNTLAALVARELA